jgi:hypothetical protein
MGGLISAQQAGVADGFASLSRFASVLYCHVSRVTVTATWLDCNRMFPSIRSRTDCSPAQVPALWRWPGGGPDSATFLDPAPSAALEGIGRRGYVTFTLDGTFD